MAKAEKSFDWYHEFVFELEETDDEEWTLTLADDFEDLEGIFEEEAEGDFEAPARRVKEPSEPREPRTRREREKVIATKAEAKQQKRLDRLAKFKATRERIRVREKSRQKSRQKSGKNKHTTRKG